MGAVDTFAKGFSVVNRHPSLLLFPLALDGLIWGLPAITAGPIIRSALVDAAPPAGGPDPVSLLAGYDLLSLLARFTPSLLAAAGGNVGALAGKQVIALQRPDQAFALVLGLLLVGFLVGSWYLLAVTRAVRDRTPAPLVGLADYGRALRRILALVAYGAAVLIGAMVVLVVAAAINGGVAQFVESVLLVGLLWVVVSLYFTIDAIVAGGLPARVALRSSALLYRVDFGAAAWIVVLATLIRVGLPLVWQAVATTAPGLVGASVVNAYVGTGVTAATMVFFLEQWAKIGKQASPVMRAAQLS